MKRWLIIGYFVILVAVIIGLTLTCIGEGYPLWILISMPVILGLVAISILLYGLSYKPKRFAWFWKIVPLALVAQYAVYWFLGGRASFDPEAPLSAIVVGYFVVFAGLFTAFYLSFKFGYSKTLPAGKSSPKFIAFIFVITSLCVASRFFPLNKERINIKVNYVAEYNKITKPANYDPNDNAAPYYQKAFELCVERPEQLSNSDIKAWPKDLPNEKQVLLEGWVSANSDALEQLKLGTQKPYYWPEYQGSSMWDIAMPSLSEARKLAYAACSRAKLNAAEGSFKGAFSDLLVCYRFGAHFTGCKTSLIAQLLGIGISSLVSQSGFQILNKTEPNTDSLKDFQIQLQSLSENKTYLIDFTAEKLLVYDNIQRAFTDDGKGQGHIYGTRPLENKAYMKGLFGEDLTEEQKRNLERLERRETTSLADKVYDYFEKQAHKTPWQLHNEGENIKKIAEEMTKDNFLLHLFMPAVGLVIRSSFRCQAETDALITTLALLQYKAEKDRLPENLNQLVTAGYLKELPVDPFSDRPLVYKQIGDDFILYSFGADFDDDGRMPSKWGEDEQGGDQVFWPVNRKQE